MSARAGVIVTAALLLVARAALHAQQTDARADSLLRDGAIGRAESLYYAAVRVRPRDPEARWALGRYLISRGAVRVGATLVEEAVRFGLDPAVGAATLAPAYLQIGEYHALAALPSTTLSAGEVARARWLVEHPSRIVAPDSIIVVDYRPSAGDGAIGTIPIRVNGRTVDATVTARVRGLVLSDTTAVASQLRRFSSGAATARGVPVAVDSLAIGRLSMSNAPATIASGIEAPAMIGIDAFAQYAPTFEPRDHRVLLHPTGVPAAVPAGVTVLQTLRIENDLLVARGGGWASLASPVLAGLFRDRRWTVDAKRGRILVAP
ncbi:MAG TPA: hypothetical protein VL524_13800 [Gemmatimonadaceae bacterium]|nr:hypothetical protein [Gemmatimonadaceae bacterium]